MSIENMTLWAGIARNIPVAIFYEHNNLIAAISSTDGSNSMDIACRMANCWNAFHGITSQNVSPFEALVKQRDELSAELTALRLERDMRQMAEKRNAELLAAIADHVTVRGEYMKQRDLLLKALKWIYRGEGKPVDVDAAISAAKPKDNESNKEAA